MAAVVFVVLAVGYRQVVLDDVRVGWSAVLLLAVRKSAKGFAFVGASRGLAFLNGGGFWHVVVMVASARSMIDLDDPGWAASLVMLQS
jgi:hypothetical protein